MHHNVLAYPQTGRRYDDSRVWNYQRDCSVILVQFERCELRISFRVLLDPKHSTCTLDDDLFGTRATDNQVRCLSVRKTDK